MNQYGGLGHHDGWMNGQIERMGIGIKRVHTGKWAEESGNGKLQIEKEWGGVNAPIDQGSTHNRLHDVG